MAMTRRQFITRTGALAAGSFLGPSLFRNPFIQQALASTIGDRYFIVVYLDGGNDGLNTVVPLANGTSGTLRTAYQAARFAGSLQLTAADLTPTAIANDPITQTPLALHPGLIGLKQLYSLGHVAVIQGCGYPDYSLSHEQSRTIWQTSNPLSNPSLSDGWMGRYLKANYGSADIPAVCVRYEIAPEFAQTVTNVLAMPDVADFGFPYDYNYDDQSLRRTAFSSLYAKASMSAQPVFKYLGDNGTATLTASESYPNISDTYESDRPTFANSYSALQTGFARNLREVAKIIYGVKRSVPNVNARFLELRNGGYDTHSDQGTTGANDSHNQLHHEVGDAIEKFYEDCNSMGVWNKVCLIIWSEFSRRPEQNDSGGTDHGSQGPVFVIGGGVNGGVYGNHPNINAPALDDNGNTAYSQTAGDPHRSTDFRDVYGTILKKWLGMTTPGTILPADGGDPNLYWTSPNFNMGFLT